VYIVPTLSLFLGRTGTYTTMVGGTSFTGWYTQNNIFVMIPTSGDTITWAAFVPAYVITGVSDLGALTMNLPTSAPDRVVLRIIFSIAVTALTIATTDGATIKPAITTAAAGTAVNFVFNGNTNAWYAYT